MQRFPEERQKVLMIAAKREANGEACHMKADGSLDWKANNLKTVVQAVQKSSTSIFSNVGAEFIAELSTVADDRIYMPGEIIIKEGDPGDSLFIMVSGQAQVYIAQEVNTTGDSIPAEMDKQSSNDSLPKIATTMIGMIHAGEISGEMAMLGISKNRSATVEAMTICVIWEVSQESAMPIIEAHPDSQGQFAASICNHLEHTVSNCIDSIDLFKSFERKFRMLLGLYCDRHAYFPGQIIFQEGLPADGLCILNLGLARLERKNVPIKMFSPGCHCNSTAMLGIHKLCFCTLTAVATCHVVVISRSSYVHALEQYPADEAAKEVAKQEQASTEQFRESVRRCVARGVNWNKSQAMIHSAFQRLTHKASDKEILERAWKRWWDFTVSSSRQRRELKNRKEWTRQWVAKQREAVAHRQRALQRKASPLSNLSTKESTAEASQAESTAQAWNSSPPDKASKYKKLSSLYLGHRREWESMIFVPRSSRQRQQWGLSGNFSSETSSRELISSRSERQSQDRLRTPRDSDMPPHDGHTVTLPALGKQALPGAIWPGGDRSESLSWDAADALGW